MNSLILRVAAPYLAALMLLFSVFVTLRGHNEPGGGFIGGLIAATALGLYGLACGIAAVRRALVVHPVQIAGAGLLVAILAGLLSIPAGRPFLTGLWWLPSVLGSEVALSTPLVFDLGVYLVVLGAIATIVLELEEA